MGRFPLAIALACASIAGCSSSSPSSPSESAEAGPQDGAAADAPGGGDAASPDAQSSPPDSGATDAGSDGSWNGSDITTSPECKDYCAKVATCSPCDPSVDCAVAAGSCVQAERTYLECKATTGQITCSSGGWTLISNCQLDNSVCPPPPPMEAGPTCPITPPDHACAACAMPACGSDYTALMNDPEWANFSGCVTACEQTCQPAASCPSLCSCDVGAYNAYINLLYCANLACPMLCGSNTVLF
jgi:hypothetical protein